MDCFTSVDPLAEKDYLISPYAYCSNNPVNRIDPNGMDDVYSREGEFIEHNDNEIDKKTDHIVIRDQNFVKQALIAGGLGDSKEVKAMPDNIDTQLESTLLSAESYSNIFTDVLSDMKDVDMSSLYNGAVSVTVGPNKVKSDSQFNDPNMDLKQLASEEKYDTKYSVITATIKYDEKNDNRFIFSTVSNVKNSLGAHEKISHGQNITEIEANAYQFQFSHPSWRNTTEEYKNKIRESYNKNK